MVISGHATAVAPDMAAGRRVLISREAQAAVPVASSGTQCALRFVSSAASQTEDDFPGAALDALPSDASSEMHSGEPAAQGGGESAVDASEEQGHSCPSFGGTYASALAWRAEQSGSHISLPPDAAAALSAQAQALLKQPRAFFSDHESIQVGMNLQACQPYLQLNNQRNNLTIAERTLTEKVPFICLVCNKHFLWKGSLVTHMRQHTGEKPFACRFCPELYTRKHSLQLHERSHTGERPYVCGTCQKSFSRRPTLVKHEKMHTGEKPYECSICQKRFAHKTDQVRHDRVHTGEKPYMCNVCDKKFSQRSSLVAHEKTHSGEKPLTCPVCQKQFFYRWSLVMHERTHTGERPHGCVFCPQRFAYRNALLKHERRLHAVVKPFQCTACDAGFLERAEFVSHMRLHALEKPENLASNASHKGGPFVDEGRAVRESPMPNF